MALDSFIRLQRAGKDYALPRDCVSKVLGCSPLVRVAKHVTLVSAEGCPVVLAEPVLLVPPQSEVLPLDAVKEGVPSSPGWAIVLGFRGDVQFGLAADHVELHVRDVAGSVFFSNHTIHRFLAG